MPHTVPSSPTKGAVLPTEASSTCANSSRRCDALSARRSALSTRSPRSTRASNAPGISTSAAWSAASASGEKTRSRSARLSAATPSASVGACQKRAIARVARRFARTSTQLLTIRKHQLATDIANST